MPAATSSPSNCHWPSNRSVGRWLANLSSRISTHTDTPNTPLGISLGAGVAVTFEDSSSRCTSADNVAVGSVGDRLGPRSRSVRNPRCRWARAPRRTAGTHAGLRATRGDPRPRASGCSPAVSDRADPSCWPRLRGVEESSFITLAFKVIRAIPGRRFFALATEELILELSVLTAKIFNLGFEVLGPMHGPSVLSLPIPDLLPQFEILTPQIGNFLAQFEHFATKLPHQFGQISRLGGRKCRQACLP